MDGEKELYPWIPVDEVVRRIDSNLPVSITEMYSTGVEWKRCTHQELAEMIEAERPHARNVRTPAQIAANVVAKRRARKKAAKVAKRRNRKY